MSVRFLLPLLLGLALAAPAAAQTGTALVLGNETYAHHPASRGAAQAARIAATLGAAGFAVIEGADMSAADMRAAFERLSTDVHDGSAERVVIVLAGHFVQSGREIWLLGSDARAPGLGGIDAAGLRLGAVLEAAGRLPGGAVVMLGHQPRALTLPPPLRAGLSEPLHIPQGVTVLRGPTDRLARVAAGIRPGAVLAHVAAEERQVAIWGFAPVTLPFLPADLAPAVPADAAAAAAAAERTVWEAAEDAGTAAAYQGYLDAYPDGRFAPLARAALDRIAAAPETLENALGLTRAQRRTVQEELTLLGFNTRGIDGIFGPGTRAAISGWQRDRGLPATGFLDADQRALLAADAERRRAALAEQERRAQAAREAADRSFWTDSGAAAGDEAGLRAYLQRYPQGLFADVAQARIASIEEARDREAWDVARRADSVEGYRLYLRTHPRGLFADVAGARLAALTGPEPEPEPQPEPEPPAADLAAAEAEEAGMGLNRLTRSLIEGQLFTLGFNPGQIDGRFDNDTRAAIRAFQRQRDLPETGFATRATLNALIAEGLPLRFD